MSDLRRRSPYSNRNVTLIVVVVGILVVLAAIAFRSLQAARHPGAIAPITSAQQTYATTPGSTTSELTGELAPNGEPRTGVAEPVTIELIDTSRPLISAGETLDQSRRLPTTVWHPEAAGVHPLVVFAHGYAVGPLTYARFCAALAAMGFVVAAPSFPLADESRGNGLDRSDIDNEAGDINFVIAQLRASDPTISKDPVAVIGHSDGATAALIIAERPGSLNPAVGAVIAIAPDALTNDLGTNPPPVLIIHGTEDPVASFADGQGDFERFAGSRFLLALDGADHLAPIVGDTPWTPVLDRAVELFLAQFIQHRSPSDDAGLTVALDELDLSYALHAG
jgi:pimeloyl-ACP methyl ester carboxylesterase